MIFSSFCKYIFLILLLSSYSAPIHADPYHHHHHHDSDAKDVVVTAAAVGLFAAATYGVYKFCEWLFSKTDEQILAEAQKCFDASLVATRKGIEIIHQGIGDFPESRKEQYKMIKNVNEDFLYHSALAKIYSYALQFDTHERQVADMMHIVQERVNYIRKKGLICPIMKELDHLSKDLAQLKFELHFCNDFIKEHASYFEIFDREAYLMGAYEFEINSLDRYADNPPYLREAIRMAVMKKAAHHKITYPYITYVNAIEKDLKDLERHIARLSHHYHNRTAGAGHLLQKLHTIYNVVVSEDAYRQELRDYQKELLERERIAAEHAKAQAAQAQAYAAQLQAQAMQQQAYEMHQQNHLQAQQNHILANQAQPRVNVYL